MYKEDNLLYFPNGQAIPKHLTDWEILWFNLHTGENFKREYDYKNFLDFSFPKSRSYKTFV